MKRISAIFLQVVVVLIGIVAAAFLLYEPLIEGRNAHTTLLQVYFNDPFLVCAYAVSALFFIGLYQAFMLLGYVASNTVFSPHSIRAVRIIRRCALSLAVCVATAEAYLLIVRPGDDIAGGVFMGLLVILFSMVVAAGATVCEGVLQGKE